MRAVRFSSFGNPEDVLQVQDIPRPGLARSDALIRMAARPINPSDLLTIRGRYGALPALPATPGWEGAGAVEAAGAEVDASLVGHRVVLLGGQGTWQELLAAPAETVVTVPVGVPDEVAAQAVINPLSVWAMLEELSAAPGEWLVQTAAASALGRLVIQLARRRGLRTINLVRRAEQAKEIEALSPDVVIVGEDDSLLDQVNAATGSDGVGFALDAVGGRLGGLVLRSLRRGGTMLVHGSLAHPEPLPVPMGRLLTRSLTVRGFWVNAWRDHTPLAAQKEAITKILAMVEAGDLRLAEVEARFDLGDVRQAVQLAAQPGRTGKVLLTG